MTDEMVDIVDLEGRVIGNELKSVAHERRLLHPIVRVILIRPTFGEVYLQQRAADKEFYPNRWEGSMAEHVHKGESYIEAVRRGVREEFGRKLQRESFKEIGRFTNTEATGHTAYSVIYVVTKDKFNPYLSSEAQDCAWVQIRDVTKEVNNIPEKYTPGFITTWNVFCKSPHSKPF